VRLGILAIAAVAACAGADRRPVDWAFWGGDPGSAHYSSLTDLNPGNVLQLRQTWIWKPGEAALEDYGTRPGMFENTPVVIDGVMYLSTPYNKVVALNPETGAEIWSFDPKSYVDGQPPNGTGYIHRGIAYWRDSKDNRANLLEHALPADFDRRKDRQSGQRFRRQRHCRPEPGTGLADQQNALHRNVAAGDL